MKTKNSLFVYFQVLTVFFIVILFRVNMIWNGHVFFMVSLNSYIPIDEEGAEDSNVVAGKIFDDGSIVVMTNFPFLSVIGDTAIFPEC